jgi:hypothetical protein
VAILGWFFQVPSGRKVAAAVATAVATAHAPAVIAIAGATVNAVCATATAKANPPAITQSGDVLVVSKVATATAQANAPTPRLFQYPYTLPIQYGGPGDALILSVCATATARANSGISFGVPVDVVSAVATATAQAGVPSVITTSNVTINAVCATATAQAGVPFINTSGGAVISSVCATATAQAGVPTVSTSSAVASVPATATAQANPPGLSITVPSVAGTASGQANPPVVTTGCTVFAVAATATAQATAPAVTTTAPITFSTHVEEATNTATTPTHTVSDLIIGAAWAGSATTPGLPSGYTSKGTTAANPGSRIWSKVAAGTNNTGDPFGTSTNAAGVLQSIYRASAVGNVASNQGATGTVVAVPALTLSQPSTSWVLIVIGHLGATNGSSFTPPAGFTKRSTNASANALYIMDSNAPYGGNLSAFNFTVAGGTQAWTVWAIEILA